LSLLNLIQESRELQTTMPKILLAGDDIRLLGTRAAVLAKTGADVIFCVGSQTVVIVKSERPDIVVLCHSLLGDAADDIADEIRECCKTTKILMVRSELEPDLALRDEKFDASCLSRPERLIALVSELLGEARLHPAQAMKSDGSATVEFGLRGDYPM
jgi:DNA-binding response OmpR family regulator